MDRNFKIITGPATEPVTATEVKLYSRVFTAVEDSLVDIWIRAGREAAEWFQHRAYITQTIELAYDYWPPSVILFPRCPLVSVTSVNYYDEDGTENTFSSDNYQVDTRHTPGRLLLNKNITWPTTQLRSGAGVVITYVAGFGTADDVPRSVKDAIMLYCAYRYENRIAEDGTIPDAFYDILQADRIEDR
jgi:uncharacterized phiE125 gp8 family phage protein